MNNSDIFKTIKDMEDEHLKRINELTSPSWIRAEHLKTSQKLSSPLANPHLAEVTKLTQIPRTISVMQEVMKASKTQKYLPPFSIEALNTSNQKEHRLFTQFSFATSSLENITKQSAYIQAQMLRKQFGTTAALEITRKQSALFNSLPSRIALGETTKLSRSYLPQATLAWEMASYSLTNRMKDIGLLAQREMLSARLFEVPNAYAEFVSHTANRLAENPIPDIAARLRGSLNLAEYQLLEITDTFNSFIVVPEDNEEPERKRILNVPREQQNELLDCEFVVNENDTVELINASSTAQTQQMARRVFELVVECNEAAKTSGLTVEIFKPTTRLITVCNDLPWISATDKWRFGDVLDCLYFIFYEGAGKDKLRFLEENGGPLTKADCEFIWCIKHLRNKWIRHDADHGNTRDIQKSWASLAQQFQWLGLANHPTNADFQCIHYKLLDLAEKFLLCILSRLPLK